MTVPAANGLPPVGRASQAMTLLGARWRMLRNTFLRGAPKERRRARTGLLATALMAAAIGYMSLTFFEPLVASAEGRPEMERILDLLPAFGLFSAFWMLLLSAVTVGIQTFFLNQEFSLLLSSPVKPGTVFAAKFAEATAANAALFLTIGGPMFVMFAYARGVLTAAYLGELALVLAAFSALPTALGLLLSFVLMRLLPAGRTRDLLAALGISAFAVLYIGTSVAIRRTGEGGAVAQGTGHMARVMGSALVRSGPWAWAGDALAGMLDPHRTWAVVALLWLVAAAAVWAASLAARWLHWRGWTSAQETASSGASSAKAAPVGAGWEQRLAVVPGPTRAVFLKDLRTLRRDLRQLTMLFIPVAAIGVFIYNASAAPQLRALPTLFFMLTLFLLLAPISLRLAMSAFVAESRAMWLVMSAPGGPWRMLVGKFLYALLLSLPLAVSATVLYAVLMGMAGMEVAVGILAVCCATAAYSGIGVGSSAFFTDFGADNPRFAVSAGARLATFALQALYLGIVGLVLVVVWAMAAFHSPAAGLAAAGAAVIVPVVTVGFVLGPLSLAARRLRSLEW